MGARGQSTSVLAVVGGVVMVTGASGLLGTWLRRTASGRADVVSVAHRSKLADEPRVVADLRDGDAVRKAVGRVQPSLVIHAAYAQDRPSIVEATVNVSDAAAAIGAEVLYVSTDAVFSGDGTTVSEASIPSPVSDYGTWKREAETAVLARAEHPAVVRISLIVSLDPADAAAEKIASGAARADRTEWYRDEFRQPAMAGDIAEGLWRIADLAPQERQGTWHLPGPERLSRHEMALRYVHALELDPTTIAAVSTPASACRPRDIRMQDDRARDRIGWSPAAMLR